MPNYFLRTAVHSRAHLLVREAQSSCSLSHVTVCEHWHHLAGLGVLSCSVLVRSFGLSVYGTSRIVKESVVFSILLRQSRKWTFLDQRSPCVPSKVIVSGNGAFSANEEG